MPPPPSVICEHVRFGKLQAGDAETLERLSVLSGIDDAARVAKRVRAPPSPPGGAGPKTERAKRDREQLVGVLARAQEAAVSARAAGAAARVSFVLCSYCPRAAPSRYPYGAHLAGNRGVGASAYRDLRVPRRAAFGEVWSAREVAVAGPVREDECGRRASGHSRSRKKTPCLSASKPARPACTARLHFESWEQTSPVFAFLIGRKPRKTARCLVPVPWRARPRNAAESARSSAAAVINRPCHVSRAKTHAAKADDDHHENTRAPTLSQETYAANLSFPLPWSGPQTGRLCLPAPILCRLPCFLLPRDAEVPLVMLTLYCEPGAFLYHDE